jgi:hypothetical protein
MTDQVLLIDALARAMSRFAPGQDERQVQAAISAAQEAGHVWFHGGVGGLQLGDLILPPSETGAVTFADIVREHDPAFWQELTSRHITRRDRVYCGPASTALQYSALWSLSPFTEGDGAVYAVEPAADADPDPAAPRRWLEARRATVTAVVIPRVTREYVLQRSEFAPAYGFTARNLQAMYRSAHGLPETEYRSRVEASSRQLLRDTAADVMLERLEALARQWDVWRV